MKKGCHLCGQAEVCSCFYDQTVANRLVGGQGGGGHFNLSKKRRGLVFLEALKISAT